MAFGSGFERFEVQKTLQRGHLELFFAEILIYI
jgi:hypothetical protein